MAFRSAYAHTAAFSTEHMGDEKCLQGLQCSTFTPEMRLLPVTPEDFIFYLIFLTCFFIVMTPGLLSVSIQ